jgi:uncharacterized protein
MKTFLRFCFPAFLWITFFSTNSFAQKAIPELWGQRVHDEAHALKQSTVDQLEKNLKRYEDSTSNQIAILILPSLDGDVLEQYSLRVAEKWKLGQQEKDNGALLLIVVDDHKMRIEVGQGLEGVLTDALSNRIIRNEIAPAFRRGDFDAGVTAGILGMQKAIGGEYSNDIQSSSDYTWIAIGIGVGLFCVIVLIVTFVREFSSKETVVASSKKKFSKATNRKNTSDNSSTGIPSIFSGSGSEGSSFSSSGSSFSGGGGSFGGGGSSGSW